MPDTNNRISSSLAAIVIDLMHDPAFKPSPLLPASESMDDLFGLCRIEEDGSCSLKTGSIDERTSLL